jgi:hypothetical protein
VILRRRSRRKSDIAECQFNAKLPQSDRLTFCNLERRLVSDLECDRARDKAHPRGGVMQAARNVLV